jgi:2-methylcitrate dehydratase
MVAVALIMGDLKAEYYEDKFASNTSIYTLREKMEVIENKEYSKSYLDANKRSIANSVQLFFKDTSSEKIEVHYPIGHRKRREEGIPELMKKYKKNMHKHYNGEQLKNVLDLIQSYDKFEKLSINDFMTIISH